jgi:hypothetical protein
MKTRFYVLAFVALAMSVIASAKTPWEEFITLPTPEHAGAVNAMVLSGTPNEDQAFTTNERGLMILDAQVRAFDKEAVELSFRLLKIADGHYGEMLSESLGGLIRPNPKMFLQHFARHQKSVVRLDALVGNFGVNYIDSLEAQRYEVEMRIKALKSVSDPKLRAARELCIAELQKLAKE